MKRLYLALFLVEAISLSALPPYAGIGQERNLNVVNVLPDAFRPAIPAKTAEKEKQLIEKDKEIDSLFLNLDKTKELAKEVVHEVKVTTKIMDATDRSLDRIISKLNPVPLRVQPPLKILIPVKYTEPENKLTSLPEINKEEERDENFFRNLFKWFK